MVGTVDRKLLAEVRERWDDAISADRENRARALADARFEADTGDDPTLDGVWPSTIRKQREDEGRICLTINKSRTIVRQVTNELRLQPPAINVSPAEQGDIQIAAVYEGLIRSIEQRSKAKRIYARAGEDAARGNMGFWRVTTDYVSPDSFDQELLIKPILNPLSVVYDPAAQDSTCRDARFCFVYDDMPRTEFEVLYKGKADTPFYAESNYDGTWISDQTIRVAEYWKVEEETKTLYQLIDGSTAWADDPNALDLKQQGYVKAERKSQRKTVCMYKVSGAEVLEKTEWLGDRIPIIPVWGEEARVGSKRIRNGVLTYARDAIRLHTFARSANAETVASQPKAPWLVTPKMITGYEAEWAAAAKGNPAVLPFNPDASVPGSKPERMPPPVSSSGWVQEAMQSADDIKSTTGIFDASLGAKSNETSGKAITARQREGDVGTFAFIDNVLDAIEETGRVLIDLIPKVIDTARQVRILGKKMEAQIVHVSPKAVDDGGLPLDFGKYDVSVSTGPSVTTQRQETAEILQGALQSAPMLAQVILPRLAAVLDLPDADEFAEEVKQAMQGGQQQPPPPNPKDLTAAKLNDAKAEGQQLNNLATAQQLGLAPMGFAAQAPNPATGTMPGAPDATQGPIAQ